MPSKWAPMLATPSKELPPDDGQWSVVFDGGGGNVPKPATQAEIEALAAARKACPYR